MMANKGSKCKCDPKQFGESGDIYTKNDGDDPLCATFDRQRLAQAKDFEEV